MRVITPYGAVIYQLNNDGEPEVITCASRTLKGPEISYNTTEKKLLVLVWILKKYQNVLSGAEITHRTDHMALTFLKKCKLLSSRLLRWTLAIQDFNVNIEHCPGKQKVIADALSRFTTKGASDKETREKRITLCPLAETVSKILRKRFINLRDKQRREKKSKISSRMRIEEIVTC